MRSTVLLAHNHTLVRDGLKTLVAGILGEVGFVEAADGDTLFEAMHKNPSASLAVIDVKIPAMQGGYRLLELADWHPHIPLVIVSERTSPNLARRIMNIRSVFAVVAKNATTEAVRTAITSAIAGRKTPLPPPGRTDVAEPTILLTPRQRQICALLSQGMSNKMIATSLGIGEGTVKNHITDIFRVLNATNRTQAARLHLKAQEARAPGLPASDASR